MMLLNYYAVWCLLLSAIAATPHIIPFGGNDIWLLQNSEYGIGEGDFFSIMSVKYRYMNLYIDDYKYKPQRRNGDAETEAIAREMMRQQDSDQIFLNPYNLPLLRAGNHTFVITIADREAEDGTTFPNRLIKADVICRPIPLIFFRGETCLCSLNTATIRVIDRPAWLRK